MGDNSERKIYNRFLLKCGLLGGTIFGLALISALIDEKYQESLAAAQPESADASKQAKVMSSLEEKGWTVKPLEIPEEFNALSKGVYEVTMPTEDGPRDCVATVIRTTHGIQNTVFACN